MKKAKLPILILILTLIFCLAGCARLERFMDEFFGEYEDGTETTVRAPQTAAPDRPAPQTNAPEARIREDGTYDSKNDVAEYIHTYGHLPSNYITKSEAQDLGWPGGSLEPYAPGKCIGGDRFGNREKLLPAKSGRTYYECDIDTLGADARGAKRIIYSNDGLIFYTDDHYESFTQLY